MTGCCCVRNSQIRKYGFTLVELLVVISIIALLLAVLMPALNKAREQGRSIKCRANLNTVGKAEMIFAVENNGRTAWTRGDAPGNYGFYWAAQLWSLFHGTTIPQSSEISRPKIENGWLRCPSQKTLLYHETASATKIATVWNDVQLDDMSLKPEKRWWLRNICYSRNFVQQDWYQIGGVQTAPGRLDKLKHPSNLANIIDGSDMSFVSGRGTIGPITYRHNIDGSLGRLYNRASNTGCVASYRHGGNKSLNVLLWDGHVESAMDPVGERFGLTNN